MYVKYTVVLPYKGNKGLNQTRLFLGRLFELTNKNPDSDSALDDNF